MESIHLKVNRKLFNPIYCFLAHVLDVLFREDS